MSAGQADRGDASPVADPPGLLDTRCGPSQGRQADQPRLTGTGRRDCRLAAAVLVSSGRLSGWRVGESGQVCALDRSQRAQQAGSPVCRGTYTWSKDPSLTLQPTHKLITNSCRQRAPQQLPQHELRHRTLYVTTGVSKCDATRHAVFLWFWSEVGPGIYYSGSRRSAVAQNIFY